LGFAAKRLCNQLLETLKRERLKNDFVNFGTGVDDGFEFARERMIGIDLLVPKGSDQEQVLTVWPGEKVSQEVERGHIDPLQIVEEQHQRVRLRGKYADEAPDDKLEAALCLL
jgi:hypothetical protein